MAALKIPSDGEYIDSPVIELSLRYSITPDPARLIFLPYSQNSLCQKHSVVHECIGSTQTHTVALFQILLSCVTVCCPCRQLSSKEPYKITETLFNRQKLLAVTHTHTAIQLD